MNSECCVIGLIGMHERLLCLLWPGRPAYAALPASKRTRTDFLSVVNIPTTTVIQFFTLSDDHHSMKLAFEMCHGKISNPQVPFTLFCRDVKR